jgi:Cu(I)/Ag(I) efflux system membrane protein CusA/SilA
MVGHSPSSTVSICFQQGVRTDIGIKIYGQELDTIYNIARQIEKSLQGIDGLADLYVEQLTGGKYLDM